MSDDSTQYLYKVLITLCNGKELEVYESFSHCNWDEALNELHFRISEYRFNRFGHRLIRSSEISMLEITGMGIKEDN